MGDESFDEREIPVFSETYAIKRKISEDNDRKIQEFLKKGGQIKKGSDIAKNYSDLPESEKRKLKYLVSSEKGASKYRNDLKSTHKNLDDL